jgi:hypothetical protein
MTRLSIFLLLVGTLSTGGCGTTQSSATPTGPSLDTTPRIQLSPTSITLSITGDIQSVSITNGGGATLSGLADSIVYPAGQPTGWLTATFDGTTAPTTLTVIANPAGLAGGTHTATIWITSSVASNAQSIAVTFVVEAPPTSSQLSPLDDPALGLVDAAARHLAAHATDERARVAGVAVAAVLMAAASVTEPRARTAFP